MTAETPIWIFDRVQMTQLTPITDDGEKLSNRCRATIDFGFFFLFDIGISRDRDDQLTWSTDFGWSQFRLNLSQIDNPYCEEVTKLARMIKEELGIKQSIIIDFLDDPHTMPKIIKDVNEE